MLALTTLLAAQQARKAATSRGCVSVSGWRTKRRTSAAPDGGLQHRRQGDDERHGDDERIAEAARRIDREVRRDAPMATPTSMRRPKTSTLARAMPAAG